MKRQALIAVLVLAGIVACSWSIGAEQQTEKPVLVAFTAAWCGPCQRMKPIIRQLKREGFDVRSVDCTNGTPPKWQPFVSAYPTFFVYTSDGRYVGKQVGACPKGRLVQLLGRAN